MRALLPLAVFGAALLWADPASACSPLPTGWSVGVGLPLRTDVPIEGVVYLSAYYAPGYGSAAGTEPDLSKVSVTVTDASGAPISGRLEYRADLEGLLWRASAPLLEPNARYELTVRAWREHAGEQEQTLDLRTRTAPLLSLAPPELQIALIEREVPAARTCCNISPDSTNCGYCGLPCERCEVTEYAYVPHFMATATTEVPAMDLLVYTPQVRVEGGAVQSRDRSFGLPPTADLLVMSAIGLAQHCLRIHTLRVVDGAEIVGEWTCLDASALTTVPRRNGKRFDPEDMDCIDEPREIRVDGTLAMADGGCSCTGTDSDGPAGLTLLVAFALLGSRRRNGLRKPPPH